MTYYLAEYLQAAAAPATTFIPIIGTGPGMALAGSRGLAA